MSILLTFIFGAIIGSFLNVVIYRYNSGRKLSGRSGCGVCSKTLAWYELIPVFSFFALEGKCMKCKTKISWQYPLVEFITGLVFASVYIKFGYVFPMETMSLMLYAWIIFALLMVIAVYDIRHKIIPDGMVYFFILFAFISMFFGLSENAIIIPSFWSILAGPILALPFFLLWLVSKGKWIGLGDAKLSLGIGFLFGITKGLAVLLLSFWIGAIVGVLLILISNIFSLFNGKKRITLKTEIPFAPFMILGVFIVFIFGLDIYSITSLFSF